MSAILKLAAMDVRDACGVCRRDETAADVRRVAALAAVREYDALKARMANLEASAARAHELLIRYENKTIRPEVGTGECIDDLTALLAGLKEEVSRG